MCGSSSQDALLLTTKSVTSKPLLIDIKELADCISEEDYLEVDIRHSHVLLDAMREAKKKKFSVIKQLQVLWDFTYPN